DLEPKTIGDLEQALGGAGVGLAVIYEAIMVLAGKGDVVLIQEDETQEQARAHSDKFNREMLDKARSAGELQYMASPVTGGGVAVTRFYQLFLLALTQGRTGPDELSHFVWDLLAVQGQRMIKESKTLEAPEDNLTELAVQAREFIDIRLPVLQALKIV